MPFVFIKLLTIALALQDDLQTHAIHGNKPALLGTTKTIQTYDAQNSYQYQLHNKALCEQLRDSMYEDSQALEQPQDRLPNDFMLMSQTTAVNTIKNSLNHFDKNGCYKNNFIHPMDRALFKKLASDMQN